MSRDKSPFALDIKRRSFLGLLFGAAVAVAAAPLVRVVESRWGSLLRTLRGFKSANPVTQTYGMMGAGNLADAFNQVERWNLPVSAVYMHPDTLETLRQGYADRDLFDEDGPELRLWGATVHVTEEVEQHEAFVVNSLDDPRGVAEIRVLT